MSTEGNKKAPKALKDWDKIVRDFEEENKGEENVDDLFKNIFAQGDDDMKRAMMKSYYESGGTVLSTNWKEVGKEKVQVKPPEGCEYKQWKN